MHDTALKIGQAAIEIYAGDTSAILEIGSMDVNGSLRQFAPDGSSYIGVDIEHGNGVDITVDPGRPLPFGDNEFDLILASSVFEHDSAFWQTFLDLARVLREGGYLYINVPSNGAVHRYPEDCWRFYPDSGRALERWSSSQALPMQLIESFTAAREDDIWNDFVAVFRKGEDKGKFNGRFLHSTFEGQNAWIRGASEPIKSSAQTQDMRLLEEARNKVGSLSSDLADERAEKQSSQTKLQALESEKQHLSDRIRERENELERSQRMREEIDAEAKERIQECEAELDQSRRTREKIEAEAAELRIEADAQRARADAAQSVNVELKTQLEKAEESVTERFNELTFVSRSLFHAESESLRAAEQKLWLSELHIALGQTPVWWALLPQALRERQVFKRLRRAGLFDAETYLKLYPDVASEGMNPLRHYVLHGMEEGRKFGL